MDDQTCEFPINHLNIDKKKKKFQIETGPILLKYQNSYNSAFLFINSENSCQLLFEYPALGGYVKVFSCKIEFYVNY